MIHTYDMLGGRKWLLLKYRSKKPDYDSELSLLPKNSYTYNTAEGELEETQKLNDGKTWNPLDLTRENSEALSDK